CKLGLRLPPAHRAQRRADPACGDQRLYPTVTVLCNPRDAIAALDSSRLERACKPTRANIKIRITDRTRPATQSHSVGRRPRVLAHPDTQRHPSHAAHPHFGLKTKVPTPQPHL